MIWITNLMEKYDFILRIRILNLAAQFNNCVKSPPDIPLCGKREIFEDLSNSASKCKSS